MDICKPRISFALIIIYYYRVTPCLCSFIWSFTILLPAERVCSLCSLWSWFRKKNFWIMFARCKTWIMHVNRVVCELCARCSVFFTSSPMAFFAGFAIHFYLDLLLACMSPCAILYRAPSSSVRWLFFNFHPPVLAPYFSFEIKAFDTSTLKTGQLSSGHYS